MELLPLLLFVVVCAVLMLGYPVAYSLAGVSLVFALVASLFGAFDLTFLQAVPNRLLGIMGNQTLVAVPLFVFMGVMLEKAKIAEGLLVSMAAMFGRYRGGLAISVVVVGMLLAASTGIVGATVVTMGLLSLPTMLKQGYSPALATGSICATGTLGQIIPPSIALVLLGDVLSSAYQKAQLDMGIFSPESISVGDLFVGALVPGLLLVVAYVSYLAMVSWLRPQQMPAQQPHREQGDIHLAKDLVPPLSLIALVLGSILGGLATPTEAAALGAMGAIFIAYLRGALNVAVMQDVVMATTKISAMVFFILIGASIFSLVFRGLGGEEVIKSLLTDLPGGAGTAVLALMVLVFLLGFILDFIEITFVVVPIVGPVLMAMGIDPLWLGIMIAVNLQTSFLTPPFGFALFYLRGVAPKNVPTSAIYRGVMPFILIQLGVLCAIAIWPSLVTWLPDVVYG